MAVDVEIQHIFGVRCEFRNSVAFLDSNQIIYPAGSYLVKHRLDTNQQAFLYLQSQHATITAIAVYRSSSTAAQLNTTTTNNAANTFRNKTRKASKVAQQSSQSQSQSQPPPPSSATTPVDAGRGASNTTATTSATAPTRRRPAPRLVAYSEFNNESPPAIFLYDANMGKKRRVFTHNEMESSYWKHIEFSFDGVYLLALSGSPDHTVVCWNWVKNRIVGAWRVGLNVTKVSFMPRDHCTMILVGQGILKIFQWSEGQPRLLLNNTKLENIYIMSHAFAEGSGHRMFLGTSNGKLLVWEDNELIADLRAPNHEVDLSRRAEKESSPGHHGLQQQNCIASLRALRNGLVCSCTPGVLHLYEKTDDKELYHLIREFRILVKDIQLDVPLTDDQEILGIAVSPEEEYILCTTERNLIFQVNLAAADFSQGEFTELEPLLYPTHTGSIFGLGVCHRRPLFATCGTDRTVRIWNYATRTLEMMKKFAEEALCLSFHPNGLMILVGFSDRLRLMYLMHNDIKSSHDIAIRGCRECCFSHGGQLFAAVNGNVVQVYSSVTFDTLSHLKGHVSKVRNISWSANDTRIVTTAIDGHVCTWNPLTGSLNAEIVDKNFQFQSATLSPDDKTLYVMTAGGSLREYLTGSDELLRDFDFHQNIDTLLIPNGGRFMLMGTDDGRLAILRYPIVVNTEGTIKDGHLREVTRIMCTLDETIIITTSVDGTIIMWKTVEVGNLLNFATAAATAAASATAARPQTGFIKRDREMMYTDETLVDRQELDDKNTRIRELEQQVEQLLTTSQAKIRYKTLIYDERCAATERQFIDQIEQLNVVQTGLSSEHYALTTAHGASIGDKRDYYEEQLGNLKRTCEQKMGLETEKYAELEDKNKKKQIEYEQKLQDLNEQSQKAKKKIGTHYEALLKELQEKVQQALQSEDRNIKSHEEILVLMELFCDQEMLEKKSNYERQLIELKQQNTSLKSDSERLRKEFMAMQEVIEAHRKEKEQVQKQLLKEQQTTHNLERDIRGLRKEIDERDEGLQEKERRILELNKKNQELEKFRYVLEFKQAEMEKEMAPVKEALHTKTIQIDQMEEELKSYKHEIHRRVKKLEEIRNRMQANSSDLGGTKQKMKQTKMFLDRFQEAFHNLLNFIGPNRNEELKRNLREVYHRFIVNEHSERSKSQQGLLSQADEFARQRDHLQTSVNALAKHHNRERTVMDRKYWKLMNDHMYLVREANELRNDLNNTTAKAQQMDLSLVQRHKDRYMLRNEFKVLLARKKQLLQQAREQEDLIDWYRSQIRVIQQQAFAARTQPQQQLPPDQVTADDLTVAENSAIVSPIPFQKDQQLDTAMNGELAAAQDAPSAPQDGVERNSASTEAVDEANATQPSPRRSKQALQPHLNIGNVATGPASPASPDIALMDNVTADAVISGDSPAANVEFAVKEEQQNGGSIDVTPESVVSKEEANVSNPT